MQETALRETHEEMGIAAGGRRGAGPAGRGADHIATTRSRRSSAQFQYPYAFAPSSSEVAEVLEVPMHELADPANHRVGDQAGDDGRLGEQQSPTRIEGRLIFGATARIRRHCLLERAGIAQDKGEDD